MKVAFQGEYGAFSEEVVAGHFPGAEPLPFRTLEEVFRAVEDGAAGYGVIPIENSYAGSINESYDLLLRHNLVVREEVILAINHCLQALPGQKLQDIKQVYSHPQALAQCATFLRELGAETIAVYDTAGSARLIKERGLRGAAAIASARAAALYGLEVLASDIQSSPHNYTKFYVLATMPAPVTEPSKTALVMATPDRPGALYQCLGILAQRGINLTKLESRPRRDKPWEYLFYVDCEGHRDLPPLKEALDELSRRAAFLKILGSFPPAPRTSL